MERLIEARGFMSYQSFQLSSAAIYLSTLKKKSVQGCKAVNSFVPSAYNVDLSMGEFDCSCNVDKVFKARVNDATGIRSFREPEWAFGASKHVLIDHKASALRCHHNIFHHLPLRQIQRSLALVLSLTLHFHHQRHRSCISLLPRRSLQPLLA